MKIKLFLLVLLSFTLISETPAQKTKKKITITGKVVDMYSNPVPGAFIMIDGKTTQWKTNNKGDYKIKLKSPVTQIGVFTTATGAVEETVNGRTTINFNLEKYVSPEINAGKSDSEEDVVDSGYDVVRKKNVTTPVTKSDVSGKQYTTFSTIYEMLQTIPGIWVSGSSVTIRGTGTSGSSTPLYVVNGSVVNSVSSLDPSVVKSIEVLKGPAASVYGVNGANGVILIKTK